MERGEYKKDDSYVDLLVDLRLSGDLEYALRSKTFPHYRGAYALPNGRSPAEIMEATLSSVRVRSAITTAASERGWSIEATGKEAKLIGAEMAQCFDMKTVRPLAYLAKKVIPRLFSHVYVNQRRFLQLKSLSEESAIVFMPSHRTYMDFILLQFLSFHYEINLPAIAAAVDFLNMKFMGEALRRCGAFFIRRQFSDDKLYWAIFAEYVENQLKHADRPMEFFIEGTRSRTGKSLCPKYGLLSTLLQPYFRNEIYDFHLVPVSISFSRILEESLYAYELLGFPKPKESTSGLWKAKTVLNTDFGDVYVHAGKPISVRDYFTKLERPLRMNIELDGVSTLGSLDRSVINRSIHSLKPLVLFEYTAEEQAEIRRLAHRVVKLNEEHAVVGIWPLACIALSQILRMAPPTQKEVQLLYPEFLQKVELLFDLTQRLNYHVPLRTGSVEGDIESYLRLHSNIFERRSNVIRLKPVSVSVVDTGSSVVPGELINIAVPRLMISNYSNQAMHLFADLSFLCLSILKNNGHCRERIFQDFRFLQTVFSREFVSVPGEEMKSFNESLERLIRGGIVEGEHVIRRGNGPGIEEAGSGGSKRPEIGGAEGLDIGLTDGFYVSDDQISIISKIASITESFIRGYFLFMDVFMKFGKHNEEGNNVDEKQAVIEVQKSISDMLQSGQITNYEVLSGDMIKNCLQSLVAMECVKKDPERASSYVMLHSAISAIRTQLRPFIAALDGGKNTGFGKNRKSML